MQFIDGHSFDVRSVKKTCIDIVHPDGRLIPFDTYNLSIAMTWRERGSARCAKTPSPP